MSGKNCYLFFSGYYAAVKVSQILTGHQIDNRVVRAPVHMRNSCNFAVLIDVAEEDRTMELLRRKGRMGKREGYDIARRERVKKPEDRNGLQAFRYVRHIQVTEGLFK